MSRQLRAVVKRLAELEKGVVILHTAGAILPSTGYSVTGNIAAKNTVVVARNSTENCRSDIGPEFPTSEEVVDGDSEDSRPTASNSQGEEEKYESNHNRQGSLDKTSSRYSVDGVVIEKDVPETLSVIQRGPSQALASETKKTGLPRSPSEGKEEAMAALLRLTHETSIRDDIELESVENAGTASSTL